MNIIVTIRKSTTVNSDVNQVKAKAKTVKTKTDAKMAGHPLISFYYDDVPGRNSVRRYIRVISANMKYITGLEIITKATHASQSYVFRKFLAVKVSEIEILEFAPNSMS